MQAVKQLENFSARLAGKSVGQGWQARLPGKADYSTRMPFGPATAELQYERTSARVIQIWSKLVETRNISECSARNPNPVEISRNSKYF
jgi:hypothetical protein